MVDKGELKSDKDGEDKLRSLAIDFSVIFVLIIIALCVMMYFYLNSPNVVGDSWGGPEQFGQFGDFIGGLINPIVGICTLGLVMWTIKIQRETLMETRKELNLTRKELAASNALLASQNSFADKEHKLRLLESAADRQTKEFEDARNVNVIEFSISFWDNISSVDGYGGHRSLGRNSISNMANILICENTDGRDKINFQLGLEYRNMQSGQVNFIVGLCKLTYVFSETLSEMNHLIPSSALQKYWKDKLDDYEKIFYSLTIDYVETAKNGKLIVQEKIAI